MRGRHLERVATILGLKRAQRLCPLVFFRRQEQRKKQALASGRKIETKYATVLYSQETIAAQQYNSTYWYHTLRALTKSSSGAGKFPFPAAATFQHLLTDKTSRYVSTPRPRPHVLSEHRQGNP